MRGAGGPKRALAHRRQDETTRHRGRECRGRPRNPGASAGDLLGVELRPSEALLGCEPRRPGDDHAGASPAQNDTAAADAPVYRKGRKIGRTETVLTITRVTSRDLEATIECTVRLPHGNILFNGAFNFAGLGHGVAVPVVGGTGRYKGAAGTVVAKAPDPSRTKLTFDLLPR
jgi:hypothetical protein